MRIHKLLLAGTVAAILGIPAAAAQAPRTEIRTVTASPVSFLGVGIQEINSDRAKALKLPEEAGVEITGIEPNSPAATAGLKVGDVVLEYNGQQVEGMQQFSRLVRETPAGREVNLDIFRNGARQTLTAKIGSRQAGPVPGVLSVRPFNFRMPDVPRNLLSWRSSILGIEAEALEGQLADFFGVKQGVLVRSVMKGSAADKAGIKAGDVITKMNGDGVATPAEISRRLRSLRGQSVPFTIMRNRKEVTVKATLDSDDHSEWPYGPTPFSEFTGRTRL